MPRRNHNVRRRRFKRPQHQSKSELNKRRFGRFMIDPHSGVPVPVSWPKRNGTARKRAA